MELIGVGKFNKFTFLILFPDLCYSIKYLLILPSNLYQNFFLPNASSTLLFLQKQSQLKGVSKHLFIFADVVLSVRFTKFLRDAIKGPVLVE